MTESILVAIDGSAHSEKALRFACRIAAQDGATLHLLHIAQPPHADHTLVLGAAAITVHDSREDLEQAGKQTLEAAARLAAELGCEQVEARLETGDPTRRIVEYIDARKIDVVVLGSRGLSDWGGLMLGSVSHKVSHLAPCTCVTVR